MDNLFINSENVQKHKYKLYSKLRASIARKVVHKLTAFV
jgi:DNA-binding CsgD family transcriptional regulator